MVAKAQHSVPDRPGNTSIWTTPRAAGRDDLQESLPSSTQPQTLGVGTLDNVRAVFWQAYRHLFPPHALAVQTPQGNVVISWSIMDEPGTSHPYAAPVLLRFDDTLVDAMWHADVRQRLRIARNHEPTLREGLRGYDPFARLPSARVVNIG